MFRGSRIANCFFHPAKLHRLDRHATCKRDYKSAPLQERKMIDRKQIHVKGGDGGHGCTSFRKSRHDRYGDADGGRGGRGGDVRLLCTDEFWDFSHLQHHFNAKDGGAGSSKKRVGTRGEDKVICVPMGTVVHLVSGQIPSLSNDLKEGLDYIDVHESREGVVNEVKGHSVMCDSDDDSGKTSSEVETDYSTELECDDSDSNNQEQETCEEVSPKLQPRFVAELLKVGETFTVALGGEGGRGNASMPRGFGSRKQLPSREHEEGKPGTQAYIALELKTIADVGFVGAPNAGKSTLLGAISRAKPKVGHYAFTTLRPNLGKLEFEDFFSITVADIPGLIKGAHKNVGLGHDFLRHVERTKVLAYVIDLSAGSSSLPWIQFEDLKFELEMYQQGLSDRPTIIVGTKMDEKGAVEALEELRRRLPSMLILPVCAPLEQGIHDLRVALRRLVTSENIAPYHDRL